MVILKRFYKNTIKNSTGILYHVAIVALSAAIALSLPAFVSFIAQKILIYWSIIGNEKLFLASIEMALAVSITLFFNYIKRSWKDRRLSNMAKTAGLILVTPIRGFLMRRRVRKLKEEQGFVKDLMLIGSTGFRTFVDPRGDLHNVIQNCRGAKIMLLNPLSEGASIRAKSILAPNITPENFKEQIKKSIQFLKGLKAVRKNIELKLYPNTPLLKLTILGDYMWVQHYHSGLDIQGMPEYVFKNDQNLGSLYIPFYQYFLTSWNNSNVPEYDLETDELIYRDLAGNEISREIFVEMVMEDAHTHHETLKKCSPLEKKSLLSSMEGGTGQAASKTFSSIYDKAF